MVISMMRFYASSRKPGRERKVSDEAKKGLDGRPHDHPIPQETFARQESQLELHPEFGANRLMSPRGARQAERGADAQIVLVAEDPAESRAGANDITTGALAEDRPVLTFHAKGVHRVLTAEDGPLIQLRR